MSNYDFPGPAEEPDQGYGPPPAWGNYPGGGYGYQPTPQADGLGIAAMVIGIVALSLACAYGITLLASPAALVMGKMSMKRIDESGGTIGGRGMALAGFILGIIGTALLVLGIAAVVTVVVIAVNGGFDTY